MKRWLIILFALVLVTAGGYTVYRSRLQEAEQQAAASAAAAEEEAALENVIWASGKLEPVTWAALSPVNPGAVAAIYVSEGDRVAAGDLLVELETGVLQSEVSAAQAAVNEAQAALDKLLAGASAAEIAAARAEVAEAAAAVTLAAGGMLETQAAIDTAQAQAEIARRRLRELASHPTAAELTVSKAKVAIAEAALSGTQAAYNLVRGDPQIGARPESVALYQATAVLEAAKAEAALTAQGPTPEQLAVAQGEVAAAETGVDAAESRGPSAEAALEAALARRDGAQAALDRMLAGATAAEAAMAEARLRTAEAALERAQAQLRLSRVTAPFTGQIGEINVHLGEQVAPEEEALLLGDIGRLHIVTTDLRETDVVKLAVGMPVEVTFDALPNRLFDGRISWIAPISTTEKGSTNYEVHVDIEDLDPSLRWGMTAFVNIALER